MRISLAIVSALLLSACPYAPRHSDDFSVPYARSYWTTPPDQRPAPASMTMEEVYAVHEYGQRAFHPQRGMDWVFACRAEEAVPYLKSKLTKDTVASLMLAFTHMQNYGTYDVTADVALVQQIRAAYDQLHKPLRKALRPEMDQLEGRGHAWRRFNLPPPDPDRLRAVTCSRLGDPRGRF